jgi:hypothetical protein
MTNPFDRRLDRLETEVQKRTGYGPIFTLIDDPRDPENGKRLQEAAQFRRDNPNGLILHSIVVHPPNGEPNWERFIASGTNVQVANKQALVRKEALKEAIKAASIRPASRLPFGSAARRAKGDRSCGHHGLSTCRTGVG